MANDPSRQEEVRAALADAASGLLMGPLRSDEVIESAPIDTYLTGILWPRGAPVDGIDDDAGLDSGSDPTSGVETAVPGYRAIRPCSIGITFAVGTGATVIISLGETSRYVPVDIGQSDRVQGAEAGPEPAGGRRPTNASEGGSPSVSGEGAPQSGKAWARQRLGYSVRLGPESAPPPPKHEFMDAQGRSVVDRRLSVHVRRRVGPDQHVLTVTLINEELDDENNSGPRDARCLFQAGLVVEAVVGDAPGIQPRKTPPITSSDEDTLTNALLYRDVREFAVGHGIAATWASDPADVVREVRTAWLPETRVFGTSPDGHDLLAAFRRSHPDALKAEFLGRESARDAVTASLGAFAECYALWIQQTLRARRDQFHGELRRAADANLDRCASTLGRIRAGVDVLCKDEAVWVAFALANAAMDRQSRFRAKGQGARPLVWRPFQLAFMLLVIPGLADPALDDRQCMDLLWFPTGGGKTEAYLALTAFQIFHRRLADEHRRVDGGVDVLMRYTLRLLTVQQFQRAASLIAACDAMRETDGRLGQARITLGLYVGSDATPNNMSDAREALDQEHADQKPKSSPRQLLRCPVCGSELPAAAYRADPLQPRIEIFCSQADCETGGLPLPVLTVDATIYANPPSLLIGTIDKFAQIPKRTDIRRIFGLDGGLPPGLIIQDELHLISGPLGSMAGLYEASVDLLCTRDGVRPKVIGSTATIGYAAAQVRALFDRSVLQFPPPGFDASDSFFAVRDADGPDRLYIGIPTAGRSPKFALQAVIAALLQSAASLVATGKADDASIDAYWTCVAYFNSLRELGGAYVLMQDDVPRQMQFLSGRLGTPRRELELEPEELSSRQSSRELPGLLHALSTTLAQFRSDPFEYAAPKDAVLASNMISVGVDVPRLGLMVVNGQPKSTAEYIQASSRVGRGIPGLVVTLYNFGRPRDLSHFEHFRTYHSALYRNVEATSVTPWAPRARDKALHAVVASVVRHLVPGLEGDEDAAQFDPSSPAVKALVASILARVSAASDSMEASDTKDEIAAVLEEWARRSQDARSSSGRLRYWEKKAPFGRTAPHLMCSAEEGASRGSLAWPTPNTMREVEPSTAFVLKVIPRKTGGA
ncbi:helicase-related protein [Variovorax sp. Root411]|uniref:helicase-related protein n=1 Tax=Variovorax sp. Root411 TaxID=1736530 RepID=UPI0006F7D307|nr:helicase-related protein [Variovorax sp. Root411]KQW57063.1 helicase [Variovorax sp. Root411]